jgi:hypothetical protein
MGKRLTNQKDGAIHVIKAFRCLPQVFTKNNLRNSKVTFSIA